MSELIPVELAGEYLEVHPSTLAAHEARGWRQCAKREEKDPEGAKKASVDDLKKALAEKGVAIPEGAKKASVDDLKKALAEKGVAIPEGAKKADLQALLDAAEQPPQQ